MGDNKAFRAEFQGSEDSQTVNGDFRMLRTILYRTLTLMRVSISPQESYGIMAALRRQKRPHRSNTLLWVEWSHLRHKAMKSLWELTHHYSKTRTLSLPSQLRRCRREAACQCCPGQLRGRPILLITWI